MPFLPPNQQRQSTEGTEEISTIVFKNSRNFCVTNDKPYSIKMQVKFVMSINEHMTTSFDQPSSLCHQTLILFTRGLPYEHTHTHTFNGPLSGTIRVSRYQKGKTNLDFTEARDNEWQWHQLGYMQVCISLQPDNHASTPPLSFL